jgi:dihydrofolate reductase / thymidylate synthase
MDFSIIAAISRNNGIGYKNSLPWMIPQDTRHFHQTTVGQDGEMTALIMGARTFESLKEPLQDRINIVVTSDSNQYKDMVDDQTLVFFTESLDKALQICVDGLVSKVFVIGGQELYHEAARHPRCKSVMVTRIKEEYMCDRYWQFPDRETKELFILTESYEMLGFCHKNLKDVQMTVEEWTPFTSNHEENSYLRLLKEILDNGAVKDTRTGLKTRSLFGRQLRFDLQKGFPLMTTKSVPLRVVFEELMWFIRGETDVDKLKAKNVHIWDDNTSRQTLDKMGLTEMEEGTLRYGYGFQWRHFGEEYVTKHHEYKGFDQLGEVIRLLKSDRDSRRIVLTAWNPSQIRESVLPPCHVMYIFNVCQNKLSTMLVMRSSDTPLGLPFNIASTAMLTHIMAHICGLEVGEVVASLGDCHIYENQEEGVRELLKRIPFEFPKVNIVNFSTDQNIESLEWANIELKNYRCYSKIEIPMAV